jgi:hypothetical protein
MQREERERYDRLDMSVSQAVESKKRRRSQEKKGQREKKTEKQIFIEEGE